MLAGFFIVFLLTLIDGFSAKRGAVCMLRASTEIMDRQKPQTLFFILECGIFAMTVSSLALLISPQPIFLSPSYTPSLILGLGAIIYGCGIALNGTCVLGSLNRLIAGDSNYFASFIGLSLGYTIFTIFLSSLVPLPVERLSSSNETIIYLSYILFLAGLTFIIWRFYHLVLQFRTGEHFFLRDFLTVENTRNFLTIAGLGLSSGLLFVYLAEDWSYTRWMSLWHDLLPFAWSDAESQETDNGVFFLTSLAFSGFIAGVFLASILSRSFRFKAPRARIFITNMLGGLLMGLGVGLIPGGNDTLVLYGVPGLALHAPLAIIIIMLSAVAFTAIKRRFVTVS